MTNQFKNPSGFIGRMILKGMNMGHAKLTDWGLAFVDDLNPSSVLDIGCGGGMLIGKMGRMFPAAGLHGLDISAESVKATERNNSDLLKTSRLKTSVGSADDLVFEKNSFDLVTAIETYFFWPNLEKCFSDIYEILTSGGTFLVVSEAYPHPDFEKRNNKCGEKYGLYIRENEEMCKMLKTCGFTVDVHTIPEKNWVAFVAHKP